MNKDKVLETFLKGYNDDEIKVIKNGLGVITRSMYQIMEK